MWLGRLRWWLPLGVTILLLTAGYTAGSYGNLSLELIQLHQVELFTWTTAHPFLAATIFIGVYVLAVALSLPAALVLTLTGGFLFGRWFGTIYAVIGATLGALIFFLVAQRTLNDTVSKNAGGLYRRVESNLQDNAWGHLLFMRLMPGFPFVLVNVIAALFRVPPLVFLLTTFIGITPSTFLYANLGEQLAEIAGLDDLVSAEVLLTFALLALLALMPALSRQLQVRKGEQFLP